MSRRSSLPGAAELFRTTSTEVEREDASDSGPPSHPGVGAVPPVRAVPSAQVVREPTPVRADGGALVSASRAPVRTTRRALTASERGPSGRERHEEKITVYCSPEELLDLESARLHLRGDHGLVIDRGRIVREALAVVLADLDAKGESSILVRRLRES